VHDVAYTLDYAGATAFTRAFRRWSGTTPARWQAANAAATLDGVALPARG
jgi:AraC-like DNA-binding protein